MAWSRLQSVRATAASGNNVATFTTANLSSGTKLIAAISVKSTSTDPVTSIKDASLNAFTRLGGVNNSILTQWLELWCMDTPAGDVGTKPAVTATLTTNTNSSMLIQEISGLAVGQTTAVLDGATVGTANNSSVGPATTGSYSSTAVNEYLVAIMGDTGFSVTVTNSAGYTGDANDLSASSSDSIVINYKNSTNAAESASFTLSATDQWCTLLTAFKIATGHQIPVVAPEGQPDLAANAASIGQGIQGSSLWIG